jgi:hypothetical protein
MESREHTRQRRTSLADRHADCYAGTDEHRPCDGLRQICQCRQVWRHSADQTQANNGELNQQAESDAKCSHQRDALNCTLHSLATPAQPAALCHDRDISQFGHLPLVNKGTH